MADVPEILAVQRERRGEDMPFGVRRGAETVPAADALEQRLRLETDRGAVDAQADVRDAGARLDEYSRRTGYERHQGPPIGRRRGRPYVSVTEATLAND